MRLMKLPDKLCMHTRFQNAGGLTLAQARDKMLIHN
jgi:hypothetical protein